MRWFPPGSPSKPSTCTDTGFAFANAHAMRLREDLLRLNDRLVGHRRLRGTLLPGGVSVDFSPEQAADAGRTTARVIEDFCGLRTSSVLR
ncbi:MAG: hypothetical protein HYX74_09035 [Acidobacteria bacterium]|nr:hypothetical protein [Acidobacteriota bacterium]